MFNLIFKDLFLSRRLMLGMYLCYGILAFAFFVQTMFGRAALVLISIMFSFIPIIVIGREDKFGAGSLNCALPVTRRQIVNARYLMSGILAVFGFVWGFLLALLAQALTGGQAVLASFSNWAIAFGVTVMFLSVFLPILLRFGIMSLIALATGFNVLGIVAFLLLQLAPEKARLIGALVDGLKALGALPGLLGPWGFGLVALLVLTTIVLVSLSVAQKFYAGREF